jgi:hypothetical protein
MYASGIRITDSGKMFAEFFKAEEKLILHQRLSSLRYKGCSVL